MKAIATILAVLLAGCASFPMPECDNDWAQGFLVGWFKIKWAELIAPAMRDLGIENINDADYYVRRQTYAIVVDPKENCRATMHGYLPVRRQAELEPDFQPLATITYKVYPTYSYLNSGNDSHVVIESMKCEEPPLLYFGRGFNCAVGSLKQ